MFELDPDDLKELAIIQLTKRVKAILEKANTKEDLANIAVKIRRKLDEIDKEC